MFNFLEKKWLRLLHKLINVMSVSDWKAIWIIYLIIFNIIILKYFDLNQSIEVPYWNFPHTQIEFHEPSKYCDQKLVFFSFIFYFDRFSFSSKQRFYINYFIARFNAKLFHSSVQRQRVSQLYFIKEIIFPKKLTDKISMRKIR